MAYNRNPIEDIQRIQDIIAKKMEVLFSNYKKPFSHITQGSKYVTIEIKLPKVNREDIHLEINSRKIMFSVDKEIKVDNARGHVFRKEKHFRQIVLPPGLNVKKATSKYAKNFLIVTIPKIK